VGLFGGEAALAVNNNAAALLLVAAALAPGRPIVISRGELVEIGASFRLGDILTAGGATLREVGSTNRTVTADYERALADGLPALVILVHAGNFHLVGYGGRPETKEVAAVAKRHRVPLVCDLGSGSLPELSAWLPEEPSVRNQLTQGADLVTMSGDKLLGSGQAGLMVGSRHLLGAIKRHPIARAVRIDKLNLAALEATLRLASRGRESLELIPTMAMLTASPEALRLKAQRLLEAIGPVEGFDLELVPTQGMAGGGSAPETPLDSWAVAITTINNSPNKLETILRQRDLPVVARIFANRLWLDVRTIAENEIELTAKALREANEALTSFKD
jgi:L-seryl-tRNA(Ser) seleniumtransferase